MGSCFSCASLKKGVTDVKNMASKLSVSQITTSFSNLSSVTTYIFNSPVFSVIKSTRLYIDMREDFIKECASMNINISNASLLLLFEELLKSIIDNRAQLAADGFKLINVIIGDGPTANKVELILLKLLGTYTNNVANAASTALAVSAHMTLSAQSAASTLAPSVVPNPLASLIEPKQASADVSTTPASDTTTPVSPSDVELISGVSSVVSDVLAKSTIPPIAADLIESSLSAVMSQIISPNVKSVIPALKI